MVLFFRLILCRWLLVVVLKVVSSLIEERVDLISSREELSSYECGFEHIGSSRVPFSLRYFLVTLLFLLFDLEIVFLLFVPSSLIGAISYFSIGVLIFFILFLLLGLFYEWSDGALEWVC